MYLKKLLILFLSDRLANVFLLYAFGSSIQWPSVCRKLKIFLTFPAAKSHQLPLLCICIGSALQPAAVKGDFNSCVQDCILN